MPSDMMNEMLLSEAPVPAEGDSPAAPLDEDAAIAFEDFDNPELPQDVRLDALKLLIELVA